MRIKKFLDPYKKMFDPLEEETDLRSVVAKTETDGDAEEVVGYLKSNGIHARFTDDVRFGTSSNEEGGWGVLVHPEDVTKAAHMLDKSKIKGLQFDPYTHVD